jgi:hypothetical protein
MSKNNLLRELLPSDKGFNIQYLKMDSSAKQRRNVSLACTECQQKRSKVRNTVSPFDDGANPVQCSGTNPCTTCMTESRQCLYDPTRDRRRKAHTAELLNFRVALSRTAAKLRSGTPEELSSLIQEIRNLPTDQDAVNYLVHGY